MIEQLWLATGMSGKMIKKYKSLVKFLKTAKRELRFMKDLHKKTNTKEWKDFEKALRSMTKKDWDAFKLKASRDVLKYPENDPLGKVFRKAGLLEPRSVTEKRVWKADVMSAFKRNSHLPRKKIR